MERSRNMQTHIPAPYPKQDVLSILFVFVCSELNETAQTLSSDTDYLFDSVEFPRPGDIPILNGKVFRGRRVSIREHPYIASIRRNFVHFLTGTLLTGNLVLTVAYPLIDVPIYELGVVVGQNYADRGTVMNTVILVIIHQNFNRFTLQNDIAMLRLFENVVYKGSVKSISLLAPSSKLDGATAFISGWGRCDNMDSQLCLPRSSRYEPDQKIDPMLRSVSYTIKFPNNYCDEYTLNNVKLQEGMICIGLARKESLVCPCLAVPGAPLVVDAHLAALSSWGFGCGYVFDLPLVYTDLIFHTGWVLRNSAIQHDIKRENITLLYKATKAYHLLKWINETRLIKPDFSLKADKFMSLLDVDKKIATSPGVVYDIRDYIKGGAYRAFKIYIYDEYRKGFEKMQQLKLLKPKIHTRPFLDKEAFKDIEFK